MTRWWSRLAWYGLALVAVVELARYRRRMLESHARKEALQTWEDEGGAL